MDFQVKQEQCYTLSFHNIPALGCDHLILLWDQEDVFRPGNCFQLDPVFDMHIMQRSRVQ